MFVLFSTGASNERDHSEKKLLIFDEIMESERRVEHIPLLLQKESIFSKENFDNYFNSTEINNQVVQGAYEFISFSIFIFFYFFPKAKTKM